MKFMVPEDAPDEDAIIPLFKVRVYAVVVGESTRDVACQVERGIASTSNAFATARATGIQDRVIGRAHEVRAVGMVYKLQLSLVCRCLKPFREGFLYSPSNA